MRKFLKILILTFLGAVTITSCSDDSDGIPGWPWNDNSTEKPDEPDVAEAKPRYIWIDAAANFPDYANSKENIAKDMEKIKAAGFTDIIVDVRPTTGDVLFNTNVVDQVKRMDDGAEIQDASGILDFSDGVVRVVFFFDFDNSSILADNIKAAQLGLFSSKSCYTESQNHSKSQNDRKNLLHYDFLLKILGVNNSKVTLDS